MYIPSESVLDFLIQENFGNALKSVGKSQLTIPKGTRECVADLFELGRGDGSWMALGNLFVLIFWRTSFSV